MTTTEEQTIAYCTKCKANREITGGTIETMQNGTRAVRGSCTTCNTRTFRFIKRDSTKS